MWRKCVRGLSGPPRTEKDVGRPDADAMCPQRPGLSLGPGVSCRRVWCQVPCFARWAVLFSGGSFVKCPQPSMDEVVVGSELRSDSDPLGSQQEESSLEGLGVGQGWGLARPPGSRDHVLTPSLCSVLPAWRHRRGSRAACSWEPALPVGCSSPRVREGAPGPPWPFILLPVTCVAGPPLLVAEVLLIPQLDANPRFQPAQPTAVRLLGAERFPQLATAQEHSVAPHHPQNT